MGNFVIHTQVNGIQFLNNLAEFLVMLAIKLNGGLLAVLCCVVICRGETITSDNLDNVVVANSSCVRIEMAAGFNLSYTDQDNNQQWKYVEIPREGLEVTGECKDKENRMELAFDADDVIKAHVLLTFISTGSQYHLTEVKVSATGLETHPVSVTSDTLALFPVVLGSSHNCVSRQEIKFTESSSTGFVERAMVQAFMDDPGRFSTGVECPVDAQMDNVVPLAVGGALAASAVVVMIGFLVANKSYSYKRIYRPSF